MKTFRISVEFVHLLANAATTIQPIIELNRNVYIRNLVACHVLASVFGPPQQAIIIRVQAISLHGTS